MLNPFKTQTEKSVLSRTTITKMILSKRGASESFIVTLKRKVRKYSDDQLRDDHGRWTAGGVSGETSKVIFEVAPNPDDKAALDKWNSMTPKERFDRSQEVAKEYVPKILAAQGIQGGEIKTQYGSYLDDTNASFTLELPDGTKAEDVVNATKALGYNLSQQSMMTISDQPFPGAKEVDAVHIKSDEQFTLQSTDSVYSGLRGIENSAGEKGVGGATTVGDTMSVINYPEYETDRLIMDTPSLTSAIVDKMNTTPGNYEIHTSKVYSWMPTMEADYGSYKNSASHEGQSMAGQSVQGASGDLRSEITAAVSKAFDWFFKRQAGFTTAFKEEVIAAVLKGGPGSGPRAGAGRTPPETTGRRRPSFDAYRNNSDLIARQRGKNN